VWRCHIGSDTSNDQTDFGWAFLKDFAGAADSFIFTRAEYTPDWVPDERLEIIAPSLDPFSAKNAPMDPADVAATLRRAGLVDLEENGGSVSFSRRGGATGEVRRHEGLILSGEPIPPDARVVTQVSRWDRLKDMTGVLTGFADAIDRLPPDAHLLLVGPATEGVSDDPEGAEVLQECRGLWEKLAPEVARRVHLCCLPMDDVDENAHLVNALQSHSSVVVQKSLVEGGAVIRVLEDESLAELLGTAARERVRDVFLGDRHLIQYVDLFAQLTGSEQDEAVG
jgi:trehalose synthase